MANAAAAAHRRTKKPAQTGARWWFDWHSWLGVMSGLLMFLVCWSGTIATLSNEFDWLVNPDLQVSPSGKPADMTAIHDAATTAFPEASVVSVRDPLYANHAADVIMTMPDGQTRHVYVDQYTLDITGTTSFVDLQRFFREFHRDFFGLFGFGRYLVCALAIPLIASLVSGLFFYKRWWRRFFDIRIGRGSKVFWSGMHKVVGLWSLWFVVIMAITGAWYLFEHTRVNWLDEKFVYVDSNDIAIKPLPPLDVAESERLSFGKLLDRAQAARPDMTIKGVLPDRSGYFYVTGQAGDVLVRDRANKLFIDPRNGEIVYNQTADELSPYWRWSNMADPLHFGDFGGLATKLIWFVFGLFLSGLALTGTWLHLKRLQRDPQRRIYWRGSVTAGFLSFLVLLLSGPISYGYLIQAGPMIGGQRAAADLPLGVTLFLLTWALITLAISVVWFLALLRNSSRSLEAQEVAQG